MKNIYVSNLSHRITSEDLQEAFEQYGSVLSAKVIVDNYTKQSRGFGFVEMADDAEADKAIEELNNADFDGRRMLVSIAKPKNKHGFDRNNKQNYNRKRY